MEKTLKYNNIKLVWKIYMFHVKRLYFAYINMFHV